MSGRPIQVVVWGATGVTGKRVCQRLAQAYAGQVKWAIAGRSRERLDALRNELAQIHDSCKDVPVIVADVGNKESVDAMTKQADLVIACAGPFSKYSDAVVESCVKEGAHFLDVTGEVPWVRTVIDRFDAEAKAKGVKVVNFCGFDSVPADIGTYFIANHVRKRYGRGVQRALGCYSVKDASKMPISGGTLASIIDIQSNPQARKFLTQPFSLNPLDKRPTGSSHNDQHGPRYDKDFGFWTAPFLMQIVNTRVVRRSCALQPTPYGDSFSYVECTRSGSYFGALLTCMSLWFFSFLTMFKPLRSLMFALGMLPRPGEGPSLEEEAKSSWKLTLYSLVEAEAGSSNAEPTIVTSCISDKFGGYTSTSRMVTECAMCQVLDSNKLKEQNLPEGGVLTPSIAFGDILVQRLNAVGIKSEIL